MHRTHSVRKWFAGGLVALGLVANGTTPAQVPAQPPATPPVAAPATSSVLVVAINGTKRLSMTPKRLIRTVVNDKETVARVQSIVDDPESVLVVGLQAGSTWVTLTDTQGVTERVEVVVQFDIDVVKAVLKRAFPTAQVEPIPAGTNTIVLTGSVAHAEEIEAILRVAQGVLVSGVPAGAQGTGTYGTTTIVNALTVGGVRQVQLDVTIAQVNRSELRNLGINLVVRGNTVFGGSLIGNLTQAGSNTGGSSGGSGSVLLGGQNFLAALTPGGATNIVFGIVPAQFTSFIQALHQENLAKLLSQPKLVTLSGRPAVFNSGGQQAVPEVTASGTGGGTVGTRFIEFGTQLTFLPIVLGNGKIYLEVEPIVSNLNQAFGFAIGGVIVPGRDEQRVHTHVMMEPGQTFAIGGLIQTSVQAITSKTPVLGDLPFIGPAFSTISHQDTETELVVLVTPYLVDAMDCRQAPCKLPGMETRKPDDFELFLELILEAPRGQREVFPGNQYRPAWLNDPTAAFVPCGGTNGNCGTGGACATGTCGTVPGNGTAAPAMMPAGPGTPPAAAPAPAGAQPASLPPLAPATSIERLIEDEPPLLPGSKPGGRQ
jgi:pilus assembly protein CpaC